MWGCGCGDLGTFDILMYVSYDGRYALICLFQFFILFSPTHIYIYITNAHIYVYAYAYAYVYICYYMLCRPFFSHVDICVSHAEE